MMVRTATLVLITCTLLLQGFSRQVDPNTADDPLARARVEINRGDELRPWTHLRFKNSGENFQFLIVSDRTGGHRAGVFPDALRKAELLQPEFIMSVGDLIEGYTESHEEIENQWSEFQGFLTGLDIPFFYVPGNHDISNPVMSRIWEEHFGRRYYHFRYRDVLFLCLCSDDGQRANLGEAQIEYFRAALEENGDARWNLVFIHRPLWLEAHYDDSNWTRFEELLGDRDYTVFAGHNHTYTKHVKNDRKHIILATTGGGSDLSGPNHGQFDHVAWITMTPAGPQIANLLLEGIWDEDVFTTLTGRLMEQLTVFQATPVIRNEAGELLAEPSLRFTNDEDVPLQVSLSGEPHPLWLGSWRKEISIPPNSVKDLPLPLRTDPVPEQGEIPPLEITFEAAIEPVNHRRLEVLNRINLAVESLREIPSAPQAVQIDGTLSEWPLLEYQIGGEDLSIPAAVCSFTVGRDENYLYLAARVRDDHVLTADPPARRWSHDYLELRLNPHPFQNRIRFTEQWDNWNAIYLACFPMIEPGAAEIWRRDHFPEELQAGQRITDTGFEMEIAIPLAYLRERGDDPHLAALSLNLTVVDYDNPEERKSLSSWQPEWHLPSAVIGSGAFGLD